MIEWQGFADGAIQSVTTISNRPLGRIVATQTGMLNAGTEDTPFNEQPPPRGAVVLTPYGTLYLQPLLVAQGAGMATFSSLTNITAISPDGQWIVGSGTSSSSGQPDGFRARLVLHAEGEPDLVTESVVSSNGVNLDRLRWSVRDLLVVVESRPALNPAVPWMAEVGVPRVEDSSIVLDLQRTTEQRYFRIRRVN